VVGEPSRSIEGVAVKEDDLAPFAIADGLLAKMTAASTWHLTEAEMDYLLDDACEALALAKDCDRDDAATTMKRAYEAGHATIQAGPQFAIVTLYGRVLACIGRWSLRGICHPERN
jgi:hypothetical protein